MAERFVVEVLQNPPLSVVAQGFFATADRLEQLQEVTQRIVEEVFIPEIEMNFALEGRPAPWAELSERRVRARGSDHPILNDTGLLEAAATSPTAWDVAAVSRGAVATFDPSAVPPYAFFHVTGAVLYGGGVMPVRDWTYIDEAQVDNAVDRIMAEFIEDTIAEELPV